MATTFVNRPPREAVNELAVQARAIVVIDGRVGEIADRRVSATLRPGATLFDSLLILSDMAKLRPAVLSNSIYITTPARARALEGESARQFGDTASSVANTGNPKMPNRLMRALLPSI